MISEKELQLILQEGEGSKIEFKESFSNLDKEMIAFSNSSGGRIFLGVTDDGEIKGIQISNRLKSQIQDSANNCKPKLKIQLEKFGEVLIIHVEEGLDKPYECSAGFFKRMGPNSQKMSRDEIIDSFKSEGKIRFDELIEAKLMYPKDFDEEKLVKFLELGGLSKSVGTEIILENLGVAEKREGKLFLNNAGVLFFSKEPQRFILWSVFTVVLFKDETGTEVIDRKEIYGSINEIVDKVMDFIRLYAKVAYKFTGKPQRDEIYEYPLEAIREAVINSVMHKDYFEHGHNNILKFFPNKIQIENIWAKPKQFKLGVTVFRRNHIIADLFSRIHFSEKLGSGMQRMIENCKTENAPSPKIEFTDTHFYVTFRQSRKYLEAASRENISAGLKFKLNERQKKALTYVVEKGKITSQEYRKITGVGKVYAVRELNELVNEKNLVRVGAGRSVHYIRGERLVNDW